MLHPPLSDARLGPRVSRVVGPGASPAQRDLAARALIPLPGAETWLALYQLWALGQPPHADLAGRTAAELPGPAIFAALADPLLPAPALDFMARRRLDRESELPVLVRHPQIADFTLALLARLGPPCACEAIALAHARLLAAPVLLAALAKNPSCPPSILLAAVELGVRERVPGLRALQAALFSGHVLPDSKAEHDTRRLAAARSRANEDLAPAPPLEPDPDEDSGADLAAPVPRPTLNIARGTRPVPDTDLPARTTLEIARDAEPDADLAAPVPRPALNIARDTRPDSDLAAPVLHPTLNIAPGARPDSDLAAPVPRPALKIARDTRFDRDADLAAPVAGPRRARDPGADPDPDLAAPAAHPRLAPRQNPASAPPPATPEAQAVGTAAARSYAARVALVLDPRTPLPLAMSLLHRLRRPDLRRVADARRLPAPLVRAARRRLPSS